jgi:hypothetical protein
MSRDALQVFLQQVREPSYRQTFNGYLILGGRSRPSPGPLRTTEPRQQRLSPRRPLTEGELRHYAKWRRRDSPGDVSFKDYWEWDRFVLFLERRACEEEAVREEARRRWRFENFLASVPTIDFPSQVLHPVFENDAFSDHDGIMTLPLPALLRLAATCRRLRRTLGYLSWKHKPENVRCSEVRNVMGRLARLTLSEAL